MKKIMITVLAVSLLLAMFCAQALASHGDITVKAARAYADPTMKEYVGTIPAYTALVVRDNDSYTDVYYNGKVYYINSSNLLNKSRIYDYMAMLGKGTKVYQQASSGANSYTLKKNGVVQICAVKGDWALIQSLGERGLYAFVKLEKLKNITKI